jgi:hypothetical protein
MSTESYPGHTSVGPNYVPPGTTYMGPTTATTSNMPRPG